MLVTIVKRGHVWSKKGVGRPRFEFSKLSHRHNLRDLSLAKRTGL